MDPLTNYLLLTGAGFSRSWDGWLGFEVYAYLLGCEELSEATRKLLRRTEEEEKGFEEALAELQAKGPENEAKALARAIVGMFDVMEQYLAVEISFNANRFVRKFDAIFTLNQDMLLEKKASADLWRPGFARSPASDRYHEPGADLSIPAGRRPYYKLHGSSDLISGAGGEPLLVMGGGKSITIGQHPILVSYFDVFRERLAQPDTRLFISGYGFRDPHINEALVAAARWGGLRIFVNDLKNDGPLRSAPALANGDSLFDTLFPYIVGFSGRTIRQVCGSDPLEAQKYHRFFHLQPGEAGLLD